MITIEALKIEKLCKAYPKFKLENVSFSLERGYIMGFIGRNGAGKTTTIKSILNLVSPDSGTVEILGRRFVGNELWCKQRTGVALGGLDYYLKHKLNAITAVTSRFYEEWDKDKYAECMRRFELDGDKCVSELSNGMRVKYLLTLALSHRAELLILDEPTSGLDPVSRDEILDIFNSVIKSGERSILFSTQITSDLEKCADYITYIKNGRLVASETKDDLLDTYRIVKGTRAQLTDSLKSNIIGCRSHDFGFEGLIEKTKLSFADGAAIMPATLEEIMIHIERGDSDEEPAL